MIGQLTERARRPNGGPQLREFFMTSWGAQRVRERVGVAARVKF